MLFPGGTARGHLPESMLFKLELFNTFLNVKNYFVYKKPVSNFVVMSKAFITDFVFL